MVSICPLPQIATRLLNLLKVNNYQKALLSRACSRQNVVVISSLVIVLLVLSALLASLQAGEIHWSLRPLTKPAVSGVGQSPIDGFIIDRFEEKSLTLSAPAERSHWLRRVYFDLIGLPPTVPELKAFLKDESPLADERLVEQLLASPRYGERWARHWMDVVRYAETHGHDEDAIRENAWPYRDWLIRAFNEDKPYAEFVREQVAGDVLETDDPWATAGIGFLGCGPWDESSQMGIQDGTTDKKIAQYLDRDDMLSATMSTFTSTTAHCARCHDHKFDPVSLQDYYALQAVFAGVDKVDRPFESDSAIVVNRKRLENELRQLEEGNYPGPFDSALLTAWETGQQQKAQEWRLLRMTNIVSEASTPYEVLADGSILFGGTAPAKDTCILTGTSSQARATAVQVEVMTDRSLPQNGPGRAQNGNLHLCDVRVRIAGINVFIKSTVADFSQAGWEIGKAIDASKDSAWGIHPQEGKPHRAVFTFSEPVILKQGDPIEVTLEQTHGRQHVIGRLRVSITGRDTLSLGTPLPPEIAAILATPRASRAPEQQRRLAVHYLTQLKSKELGALPPPGKIYAVASQFPQDGNFKAPIKPREVHVLDRGNVLTPLETARPGALSCLPGLASRFDVTEDEGVRRLALGNWLVDSDNVLTWRSIVNRVWHYHFDEGIVTTPNDFGKMGGLPSHPELLDWLAFEFRDRGGSLKWLHKTIVLSATYRQAAADRPDGLSADSDNRLLWRMNRRRLEAECIRDAVLSLSGMLDQRMGGPSARQFHTSPGVHVTPVVDYKAFDPDDAANLRRGVYRFVFRTVPDPLMQVLDCPDASQLAAKRESSSTPLQALAMLNNRFMVRQSEHIAARLQHDAEGMQAQIALLFKRAYGRAPSPVEAARVIDYARTHGLANACRVIINSSEFLFVQ